MGERRIGGGESALWESTLPRVCEVTMVNDGGVRSRKRKISMHWTVLVLQPEYVEQHLGGQREQPHAV